MAKSWLDWFTGKNDTDWDRRDKFAPKLSALDPSDFDPVTGTLAWDRFTSILNAEKAQVPGALLVIDLDGLSAAIESIVNESQMEILPWLAQAIRQAVRADDLVTHVNGYKFAVLLRGAEHDMAETVADRIRESVDDTLFMTAEGITSLGVAVGGVVYNPADRTQDDIVAAATENFVSARQSDRSILIT